MSDLKKQVDELKAQVSVLTEDKVTLEARLSELEGLNDDLTNNYKAEKSNSNEWEALAKKEADNVASLKSDLKSKNAEIKKLKSTKVDVSHYEDEIAEKDEIIQKLEKQVLMSEGNRKPVKAVKGKYTSAKNDKTYKFRNNIKKFIGSGGKVFESEKLMELAANKDTAAISELERLIKIGATILEEVKK